MAHGTLIGGTAYEISGGKTLVGGTGYSIDKGKTLVDGTGYEIGFGVEYVESETSVTAVLLKTSDLRTVYLAKDYTINEDGKYVLSSPSKYTASNYVGVGKYLARLTSSNPTRYVMLGASTGNVMYRFERKVQGSTYYQYICVGWDDYENDDYYSLGFCADTPNKDEELIRQTSFTKMTITTK